LEVSFEEGVMSHKEIIVTYIYNKEHSGEGIGKFSFERPRKILACIAPAKRIS
jgi:hypothetical protein